ncbi:lipopolysaccharide biosynthesis protein, partial [Bacteroides eggerthii]
SPFVNAIYPFFSRKISSNKGVESYYKIGRFFSSVLFVISLMLICISPFLVKTFLDESYYKSILDIQIMAFVILFGGMNFYYGIIGLVNMGYSKKFVACVWKAGFFSLVLCSLLSIVLKDRGAAISMIVSEILLLILIWKELKKIEE